VVILSSKDFLEKISIATSQYANSFIKFHNFPTWNLDMVSEMEKSLSGLLVNTSRPAILSVIADINGHNDGGISSVMQALLRGPEFRTWKSGLPGPYQDFPVLIRTSQS
jgi:hypothetical protein